GAIIDGEYALMSDSVSCAVLSVGTAIKLATLPWSPTPLALYVPRRVGRINPSNPMSAFRSDSLAIAGVYEVNESDKDASTLFVSLETARYLLDYDNHEASHIEVSLKKEKSPEAAEEEISALLGNSYKIADRLEQEEKSFRMISIEKWITFIMLAFILLIASFNVISTLSMLMIEKSDNMATLKALGSSQSMIRAIFIWEGWLISIFGGLLGIIAGVGLCLMQQTFGFIKLAGNEAQLSVTVYPVRVETYDLLIVGLLVIVTGLFISTITARFAPRR
ncbi:MAG: FtsX-like permease family protein, partial [Paramuribaculum sp.]|nr:FtsX-like permease family protein [Paramuribaculum sp.]